MNGVHGPIEIDPDEALFHHPWQRTVLGMALAMGATGTWNLDQSRFMRESLPPDYYLSAGYYRIWLAALEKLLVQHGLITKQELTSGLSTHSPMKLKRLLTASQVAAALAAGSPVDRAEHSPAGFAVGDAVTVRHRHVPGHTRLPGYLRGHKGVVHRVHGCHVFPDSHAQGLGEDPQWLYNVCFTAQELWGSARLQAAAVHVDCWQPYLQDAP